MLSTFSSLGGDGGVGSGLEGEGDEAPYVPSQMLMRFDPGTTDAERDQILANAGAAVIKEYSTIDWVLVGTSNAPDADLELIAQIWTRQPEVEYAEPNYIVSVPEAVPNDPRFLEQWGLNNTGQFGGVPGADISAVDAWDIFTGTDNSVVAVLDTGVYYPHPDLFNNMWRNPGEIPSDNLDNDGNGYVDDVFGINPSDGTSDPLDADGHGTHVAGIIGAEGNNSLGVTGINWDVQLMAINILDGTDGGTVATVVEGLDYVTMMKLRGTNIVAANGSYGSYFFSQAEFDATKAMTDADILFVTSAGNDTQNNDAIPHFPSDYNIDGIISVAATNNLDVLSDFSNYGLVSVDLAAPGGQSLGIDEDDILSTYNTPVTDPYELLLGTSMAAPHVTGVAALIRGLAPGLSALETKQIILDTVDLLPSLQNWVLTGGRLNALNALNAIQPFQIEGTVWNDENANGSMDSSEVGIPNWSVFVDLNNNGNLDGSEPSAVTDANGDYVLESSAGLGRFTIAQVLQPNWNRTFPAGGTHSVNITSYGQRVTNLDFGNQAIRGGVTGIKWNDIDGDGVHDADEPGLAGVYIYADLNNSGTIALGEPAAITDSRGFYQLEDVPPGTWKIREVLDPGWVMTYPAEGFHEIIVSASSITPNVDFGNAALIDHGDAPAPYPTLVADGGASHGVLAGFGLGALIDGETDGIPEVDARGDDLSNLADEDGVVFPSSLFAGQTASIDVTVMTGSNSEGALQAWVDFNADGDWNDPDEQIVRNRILDEGVHTITFDVPDNAAVGTTFARFRYGYNRDLGPTGPSLAGEVEDYAILVLQDRPIANDDRLDILQDSQDNVLDVLANDFPSSSGFLSIIAVTQPTNGAVTIAPDGKSLLLTPNRGFFSPPNEQFTYTIGDGTGKTDSAAVTVYVRPTIVQPVAVDDAYRVAANSGGNDLDVLTNDLPGVSGSMQIISWTTPASGTVTIGDTGDFLVYTPGPGFDTADQFRYTIGNADGNSTATVTIFETPAPAFQNVDIVLEVTDMRGNPITQVGVGQEFQLAVSVQDNRFSLPGIAATYLDVLYDRTLASPKVDPNGELGFEITFPKFTVLNQGQDVQASYGNAISGDVNTPGIVDEVGGFQTAGFPMGGDPLPVFIVTFVANTEGTIDFIGDPADVSPNHDVLYFEPPEAAPIQDIRYGFASLQIGGGSSSANSTPGNSLDVNVDGQVSPIDALLVINRLNFSGSFQLGEGETGNNRDFRLDVNQDQLVSPIDALLVINYLNSRGGAEGEAAGLAPLAAPAQPELLADDPLALTALDVTPLMDRPIVAGSQTPVTLQRVDSAASADSTDWYTTIGQAEQSQTARPADADRIVAQPWESLLNDIAEDVLEAWLDGEDA